MFSSVDDFLQHLMEKHNFAFVAGRGPVGSAQLIKKITCPKCKQTLNISDVVDHMIKEHSSTTGTTPSEALALSTENNNIKCPRCQQGDNGAGEENITFDSPEDLLEHMRTEHNFSSKTNLQKDTNTNRKIEPNNNYKQLRPKVGDRVLAMWEVSMWQYFHATIQRKMEDGLSYEIDWDDGDTTGILTYFWIISNWLINTEVRQRSLSG